MMRIKFAILGMGRIGKVHADTIQANSNAELAAIHDPINNEINRLQKRITTLLLFKVCRCHVITIKRCMKGK